MSVMIDWDNEERTILRVDFHGSWSLKEMDEIRDAGISLLEKTPTCTAIIMNVLESSFIPHDLIQNAGSMVVNHRYRPPKLPQVCLQVVVGASRVMKGLFSAFVKVYPWTTLAYKMIFVDTLDEARTTIAERCGSYSGYKKES